MKRLFTYLPFRLVLMLASGITTAFYYPDLIPFSITTLRYLIGIFPILGLMIYLLSKKNKRWQPVMGISVGIFFFLFGFYGLKGRLPQWNKQHFIHHTHSHTLKYVRVRELLPSFSRYDRYIVEVIQVGEKRTTGRLLLEVKKEDKTKSAQTGDVLAVIGELSPITSAKNPYAFDYAFYMKGFNVFYKMRINSHEMRLLYVDEQGLYYQAQRVRRHIISVLDTYAISSREYVVIKALLLGDKRGLTRDIKDSYAKAGVIHILAVSGLHIGILLLFINYILGFLPNYPKIKLFRYLFSATVLILYAFLVGLSPSVVRAVSMFLLISLGMLTGRSLTLLQSVTATLFILLLFNPLYLFQTGFQLSFAAVAGIGMFYQKFLSLIPVSSRLLGYVYSLMSISLSATLGTLPLTLYYFHRFPGMFLLSNLLIVPWLGLLMGLGLVVLSFALLGQVPAILITVLVFMVNRMNTLVAFLSGYEDWVFSHISLTRWEMWGLMLFIILWAYWWERPPRRRVAYVFIGIILFQLMMISRRLHTLQSGEMFILHKPGYSIVGIRAAEELRIWTDMDSSALRTDYALKSYISHYNGLSVQYVDTLPSFIEFSGKIIQVIDSTKVYFPVGADYVLLRKSPYLHPGIVNDSLKAPLFIIDGSDYSRFRRIWKHFLPNVYDTYEQGAFVKRE